METMNPVTSCLENVRPMTAIIQPLDNPRGSSLKKNNFVNMSMSSAKLSEADMMEDSNFQSMVVEEENSISLKAGRTLEASP